MWNAIKRWFKDSETLAFARAQIVLGFVVAAAGAMNWVPLVALANDGGFSGGQIAWLGGILFLQGAATEYLRRRRESNM